MSKNEWKTLVGVAGRLLLAYALILSQWAWAGQNQKTKDKADSSQKAAAQQVVEKQSSAATTAKARGEKAQGEESESAVMEKSSRDGSHEGIKVHGHWTIEVRNSDGTVVTHREFENSIQAGGTAALASLLGGNQLLGPWQVDLIGSPQPCVWPVRNTPSGFSSGPEPCVIVPGNTVVDGVPVQFPGKTQVDALAFTLTVTASSGQLVLNGSATAATTTSITSVATVLSPCRSNGVLTTDFTTNPPGPTTMTCPALFFPISAPFTSADLTVSPAQPVPVSAGQTIAVTVVISFS